MPARLPTGADPFARIRSEDVRSAARRVALRFRGQPCAGVDEGELVDGIVSIALAVDPPPGEGERRLEPAAGGSWISGRVLELLRRELVLQWSGNGHPYDPEGIIRILTAFEGIREDLESDRVGERADPLAGSIAPALVAELAHDLRSPLTSILTLAEALRRGQSGEVNEIQRRQLGLIYSAALGLSGVASDLIELAHGGDRLAERDPSPFSVTETLESVRDIVQPMAEEKGLEVRLVPPAGDRRLGYALALSRVLLNLTTNALKFTEEGFVEVLARARGPRRVAFSVRDTGKGIPRDAMETLYQPFRRCRGPANGYCFSGTGLGLAISRRLVEAMESELRVETRAGWGTRFCFELDLPPATSF